MTARLYAGLAKHRAAGHRTDTWITPRAVIDAIGGAAAFDLDPCAADPQPWPMARASFTKADDGLAQPWFGEVFCNPPYSLKPLRAFIARMVAHGRGVALIFAKTDTEAFHNALEHAAGVFYVRRRLRFCRPDGSDGDRAEAPSALFAFGQRQADVLAFCDLPGQFHPLRIPRGVLVLALEARAGDAIDAPAATWRDAIAPLVHAAGRNGVRLNDLYRAMADHPKARRNANWQPKIRQQLQLGPFERVGPGRWRARELSDAAGKLSAA